MTEFGIASDKGQVREANEDSCGFASEINLFVLSDGMGGLECGEVASRIAVETVIAHCRELQKEAQKNRLPLTDDRVSGASDMANRLASAVRTANASVRQAAAERVPSGAMGATVVAAQIARDRMTLAHVGDSRAYRLRDTDFKQLTRDHSFVAEEVRCGRMSDTEAAESSLKNVLIRALGVEPEVEVDTRDETILEGDTILLCSDGLTRELSDSQIAAVLEEADDSQGAADRLVELANRAGGGDNITAIVVRPVPRPVGAFTRLGRWFRG
jgi:serine/threonine protein phosphatase PrpC